MSPAAAEWCGGEMRAVTAAKVQYRHNPAVYFIVDIMPAVFVWRHASAATATKNPHAINVVLLA